MNKCPPSSEKNIKLFIPPLPSSKPNSNLNPFSPPVAKNCLKIKGFSTWSFPNAFRAKKIRLKVRR